LISVLTWKWGDAYGPEYVIRLNHMLSRHLRVPFQLFCITDNAEGLLNQDIALVPMFTKWAGVKKPQGYRSADNDLCQRRLAMFDRQFLEVQSGRFLHLDLDTVITGDITDMIVRPEPLIMAARPKMKHRVMPGFMLFDRGYLHELWETFHGDPQRSDMELIDNFVSSRNLNPPTWTEADGVYGHIYIKKAGHLPKDARVVMFYGPGKPHEVDAAWVKEHWR
jgi:hypothetical protein